MFLHNDLLCNDTCSVTGGSITYWGTQTEMIQFFLFFSLKIFCVRICPIVLKLLYALFTVFVFTTNFSDLFLCIVCAHPVVMHPPPPVREHMSLRHYIVNRDLFRLCPPPQYFMQRQVTKHVSVHGKSLCKKKARASGVQIICTH